MLGVLAQVRDLYPGMCVCVCVVLGVLAQVRGLYPGRGWPKKTHAIPSLKDQILGPSLAQHSVATDLDTQMQPGPTVCSPRAERLGPGHRDGGGWITQEPMSYCVKIFSSGWGSCNSYPVHSIQDPAQTLAVKPTQSGSFSGSQKSPSLVGPLSSDTVTWKAAGSLLPKNPAVLLSLRSTALGKWGPSTPLSKCSSRSAQCFISMYRNYDWQLNSSLETYPR